MAFRREVDHSVDFKPLHRFPDRRGVPDVCVEKAIPWPELCLDVGKTPRISGIRQRVEVDDAPVEIRPFERVADEI